MTKNKQVFRFCIGPWNERYSSVWRIWSPPNKDDIYLSVRSLTNYLKVSLHETGKFRIGFTESYNQKLIETGKDQGINRAFF